MPPQNSLNLAPRAENTGNLTSVLVPDVVRVIGWVESDWFKTWLDLARQH